MHKVLMLTNDDLLLLLRSVSLVIPQMPTDQRGPWMDVRDALSTYCKSPAFTSPSSHRLLPDFISPQLVSPKDFEQARWKKEGRI